MITKLRKIGNDTIKSILKDLTYNTVLNLGCGKDTDKEGGFYSNYFKADKVIKIDPNAEYSKNLDFIAKAEELPLGNKTVDLVFLNWVFIFDDPTVSIDVDKAIEEMARVLRNSGKLIISYSDFTPAYLDVFKKNRECLSKYFTILKQENYQTHSDVYINKQVDWQAEILLLEKKSGNKYFIDGGAYDGCSARKFRKEFDQKSEYKIISFEPSVECKLLDNHILEKKAIWIMDGNIEFYQDQKSGYGNSLMKEKKTGNLNLSNPQIVECISLSNYLSNNFSVLDEVILKLDIEGAEYKVLSLLLKDGTIKFIDKLYLEWHWKKINLSKEEHEKVLKDILSKDILISDWDAIGY